jgi:hypothetical protein
MRQLTVEMTIAALAYAVSGLHLGYRLNKAPSSIDSHDP